MKNNTNNNSEEIESLFYGLELLKGKDLSDNEKQCITDTINTNNLSISAYENVAILAFDKGITNFIDINFFVKYLVSNNVETDSESILDHFKEMSDYIKDLLGHRYAIPFKELFSWLCIGNLSIDLLTYACERTLEFNPKNPYIYFKAIVNNYIKQHINCTEAAKVYDESRANKDKPKIHSNNFNTFTQTDLSDELREMENLFLENVNRGSNSSDNSDNFNKEIKIDPLDELESLLLNEVNNK